MWHLQKIIMPLQHLNYLLDNQHHLLGNDLNELTYNGQMNLKIENNNGNESNGKNKENYNGRNRIVRFYS
jgi:hypothetical protein